jgi:hypothetical protein
MVHQRKDEKMETTTNVINHTFNVGDYAWGSWGYDQTNIDFYVVTRRTEKTVWLQPVKAQVVQNPHAMAEYVAPTSEIQQKCEWKFLEINGETYRESHRVDAPVQSHRIKSWQDGAEYASARFGLIYPYDNKPKLQTHYH